MTDLAGAADYLYGLEPTAFVAARDAIVKEVRAGGDRELAARVKALRKPSIIAAELNWVVRSSPEAVDELLVDADALGVGHRALLAGDPVDLANLQARHRATAARLAATARRDSDRIAAILEAASLDDACHPQLRSGTFAVEPTPASGFELFAGSVVAAGGATVSSLDEARRRRKRKPTRDTKPAARRRDAGHEEAAPKEAAPKEAAQEESTQEEATREEIERATAAIRSAQRRADAAGAKRTKAIERVDELERRLVEARANLDETERAVTAAAKALEEAGTRLDATRRQPR